MVSFKRNLSNILYPRGSAGSARLGLEAWRAHRELERGKPVRVFREDEL